MSTQGIGARVRRKEDARHLHGRGSFVSDMLLPGQSEVAFLRSPVAHGDPGLEGRIRVGQDDLELAQASTWRAAFSAGRSAAPKTMRLRVAT